MVKSNRPVSALENPSRSRSETADTFREELRDSGLQGHHLAFEMTHRLIAETFQHSDCFRLIKLTHYSHQITRNPIGHRTAQSGLVRKGERVVFFILSLIDMLTAARRAQRWLR